MIASSFFLTFIFILVFYWLIVNLYKMWKRAAFPLPPGPYGIPLLGYLPFLTKEPHYHLTKLGRKYGSVFGITMGKHNAVVLHDWKAVKAALVDQGDIFAGRPILDAIVAHSGGRFGIGLNDGQPWREQSRFANQRLKELGAGKPVMESAVEAEMVEFMEILDKDGKSGIDLKSILFVPIMNVIWRIMAGRRFKYGDQESEHFRKAILEIVHLTGVQADILYLPDIFLKLGYKKGLIQRRINLCKESLALMKQDIDKHKKNPEEYPNDFITSYLMEMERQNKMPTDKKQTSFTDIQLQNVALNFFIAGVETTATTLGWICLYLSLWPEIQEKVQKELDAVCGNTRSPTWADRSRLPYCNATILESQRMATVLPFSVLHRTLTSTTLLGYHIPKDSLVLPNLYNISFDPELWGDPQNFRPERFLNEEGNAVAPEYFLPFSTGPRICLGAPMAKMELFIFFTNMFQKFRFRLPDGSPKPNLRVKFGLTLPPPDDPIIAERREIY